MGENGAGSVYTVDGRKSPQHGRRQWRRALGGDRARSDMWPGDALMDIDWLRLRSLRAGGSKVRRRYASKPDPKAISIGHAGPQDLGRRWGGGGGTAPAVVENGLVLVIVNEGRSVGAEEAWRCTMSCRPAALSLSGM